ncbi:ribonuclease R [Aurantimonas sp. MSK8Z-1]|uniref:ribonuclease R n=1 Tax=Mangrovibrevibacter kandeliae TaxID=2968473 RepID=UPI0021181045|nr:ribonuclease R [Aurantimonas sp. MSK8Z-1]MCW4114686.1 ribonuclease R [Aurantimonas sp. MSK8Z-1]
MARRPRPEPAELTREAVLRFIAENPAHASKRDIARHFGVRSDDRVQLKDILADLQAEGVIEGSRKAFHRPGALPSIAVFEIRGRDDDGGLLAEPVRWDDESADRPSLRVVQRRSAGTAAGVGDRILARVEQQPGETPVLSVVRVLDKTKALALGVFRAMPGGGGRVEPVERRQQEYVVAPEDAADAKDGDLVEIEPNARSRPSLPRASVRAVVGSMASERAISTIALHAHSIPHVFPKAVLTEAEAAGPADMDHREDWRDLPLVTIDPADAKDHDDAVHAQPDDDQGNPGGIVVTVAIADVSWYVRAGTRLDAEARLRGNSVYFPDRVVPMLPERISNNLCSLREGVDRPALAVRMIFSAGGDKRRHSFHRIMMRSHAKLAYEQAQAAIDGTPGEISGVADTVRETILKPLWDAYGHLSAARERRQPLDLDLPEKKIKLDADGRVASVVVPERLDAHRLIEEFMIQANVAAAETLEQKRQALIYRAHDAPSLAKLEALRDFLRTLDISLAKSGTLRPSHFNGILRQVKAGEHESLVNEVVLRSQSQAAYSSSNIGHFGLNLMRYAHFTSPIRRYADLIVHRALVTALGLGAGGISRPEEDELEEIAEQISRAERRAMAAERDTVDRLIAHHLADRIGDRFDGRITGVTKAGLFVALPAFGADGIVPISSLGREYFHYDEAGHSLVGERSGTGYRLGDTVEVKLVEAMPLAGSMRFEMLSEPRELPRSTSSFHKSRRRGGERPGGSRAKNVAAKVRKRR